MTDDTTTVTFLENLRSQTNDSHKKLENLPVSASILSQNLSVKAYAHYLLLMRDVHAQMEHAVFPTLSGLIPDLEQRRKSGLLEADLDSIDASKKDMQVVFKSAADFSVPFALGMMYTVEGSSLGGRFILKNINAVLGYDENNGAKYFAGYGNHSGSYWKNFLNILTGYEQQTGSGPEIIAGAQFAFDAIHDHFGQNHGYED